MFPASFNTYDSLAEAYMLAGKKDLAIENYKKSIALNPNNSNGIKMLEKLQK
jgi:Tfp pilus assembly protein PilF